MSDIKERVKPIVDELTRQYPDAKCRLNFTTPHQLMVAAILAAQSTDDGVNLVTPGLFKKYPDVYAFANADQGELEKDVHSTGFFRQKSKAIIASAREIVAEFDGRVPDTIEELVTLSGVGRKTANLVIGDAYGKPAVIVDTHVKRVTYRIGLTKETDPTKIEFDLRAILPEEDYTRFNHLITFHGRAVCKAPKPKCEICTIIDLCDFG